MLAISVELIHGLLRAGSPDDTVLAGGDPVGEWPPSPARLFSALVAGDGTRERSRVSDGSELAWLEALNPPTIYADPLERVLRSPLEPRYVVEDEKTSGAVHNYPARTSTKVRPGVRQSPFSPLIVYEWPDVEASAKHLASLRARAARVGYLGCSDSPVRIRVLAAHDDAGAHPWVPDASVRYSLPVPYTGLTEILDDAFDQWSSGVPVRRSWIRTERVGYRSPRAPQESDQVAQGVPRALWLRFDRPVAGRMLLALTETLRNAVMDHYQRALPAGESAPALIHGHRSHADGPEQVCFLGLPDADHRHASGNLLGAAVLLPESVDAEAVESLRTALGSLAGERLTKPHWFNLGVALYGGEEHPWACNPERWSRRSSRWTSVAPVVFERWTKGLPDLTEVGRWCEHANLPAATDFGFSRRPLTLGGLDLHPTQVFRAGRERRPYSHMWVEFPYPVAGPIVLGRSRYLGMGLMSPASDRRSSDGNG